MLSKNVFRYFFPAMIDVSLARCMGGLDGHMLEKHYFMLNVQSYLSGPKLTDSGLL